MPTLLLVALCLTPAVDPFASPRVSALLKRLDAGDPQALTAFWAEMAKQQTPLIEPIKGDDNHRLVTFIWRAGGEARTVAVMLGGNPHLEKHLLRRHPGTDLWYLTERMRADVRCCYVFSVNESPITLVNATENEWIRRMVRMKADPLNPRREFISLVMSHSILELPKAPPQPWIKKQPDVPTGKIVAHKFMSECLGNNRFFNVYTPANYSKEGTPCGLLIVFDAMFYQTLIPAPVILDNLIAGKAIPPLITVFVHQADRDKELSCNDKFTDFLARELVPFIRKEYRVTSDPKDVVVAGASLGGLAASFSAFKYPEIFGNVLSQSGAYWYKPEAEEEPVWLARQVARSKKLSVRFYLDAGLMETSDTITGDSILASNRHLRDVLQAKGYHVHYREFNGGHEMLNWRGTLADGLLALIGTKEGQKEQKPKK